MTKEATAAISRNSSFAAAAIMALGFTLVGCADPEALRYVHDAHARKVAAWCHAYSHPPTAALQEDCIHRAWANVPQSQYWIEHHSKVAPCRCGSGSVPAPTNDLMRTGGLKPRQVWGKVAG
jgi:hypothetical protein